MRNITDTDEVETWMETLFAMDDVYMAHIQKLREKGRTK